MPQLSCSGLTIPGEEGCTGLSVRSQIVVRKLSSWTLIRKEIKMAYGAGRISVPARTTRDHNRASLAAQRQNW